MDIGEAPQRSLLARMFMEEAEGATDRQGDAEVDVDEKEEFAGTPEPAEGEPIPFRFSWRKLWRFAGPGWLMSLAYLDPGNLESDLQQGAYTGFRLVWVLWWATVMGLVLQEMSARLGVVTGRDLAQTMRAEYPRWLTYTVYVMMEVAVIASDIQEVVGSAIALKLLFGLQLWVGCLITGIDTFTFLLVHFLGVRYLEALITALIGTMTICFFVNWAKSDTDPAELAFGWVVPTMQPYAVTQAVGTIGAVIMPHNLYLHSGLVLSRKVNRDSPRAVNAAIVYNFVESAGALLVSFFINLAVVAANAGNFYNPDTCSTAKAGPLACISWDAFNATGDTVDLANGVGASCVGPNPHEADNDQGGAPGAMVCGEVGLQAEGYALADAFGGGSGVTSSGICDDAGCFIWAAGLLAAGQAATMTCTYAGQIIMGGCLHISLKPFARVMVTRVVALGPAFAIALLSQDNSIFNNVNEYLNILQSVQLPFAMLPVLHFSRKQVLMGRFRSSALMITVTNLMALLIMVVNVVLIVQFIEGAPVWVLCLVGAYAIFYFGLCLCMIFGGGPLDSLRKLRQWATAGGAQAADGAQDGRPSQQSSNLSHISINDATSGGGTRAEETGTAPLVASTASAPPRGS